MLNLRLPAAKTHATSKKRPRSHEAAETIMAPIKGRYKSRTGSTRTASPGWINADREKNKIK